MPSETTLPRIKIGALVLDVTEVKDLRDEKGDKMDGHIAHNKTLIEIESEMTGGPKAQTILHEVLHEIEIQAGLDLKDSTIDALAFGIYQVIRDNPELLNICLM